MPTATKQKKAALDKQPYLSEDQPLVSLSRSGKIVNILKNYWPLFLALCLFAINSIDLRFIQDDAYISYRYVANFLNGDGLVYNIGERVEGITNTGWVFLMILWAKLGFNYILMSRLLGFICGLGIIVMSFVVGRRIFGEKRWLLATTVLMVGINPSLAYWSSAGLETAAFAFLAMLSLFFFITENRLLALSLGLSVWLRPEGALLAGLFIIIEAVFHRRWPTFSLISAAIGFALTIPLTAFKLFYYGSILPNPFYSKTDFGWPQIQNGLEYSGRFLKHYGFLGLGYITPVFFWKKLSRETKSIWLFTVAYTVYIILIGGDVLKAHRFFIPLFIPAAIMVLLSVTMIIKKSNFTLRKRVSVVLGASLILLTYLIPLEFVKTYNANEKDFTSQMTFLAKQMKKWDNSDFSVALPTIGAFGYELTGHRIIDMLGLTDTTIARHSEEPIPGMQSTWKEQKHNSRYILESEPDYIVFSTGIKPSAPAEMALMLHPQFLESYRSVVWFYEFEETPGRGKMLNAFKKVRPVEGNIVPTYPLEYVDRYKRGLELMYDFNFVEALENYDNALKVSPQPYNLDLVYQKASIHVVMGQDDVVKDLLDYILKCDSMAYGPHKDLYSYAILKGDTDKAELHRRWLVDLVPWYVPRLDSLLDRRMESLKLSGALD